MASKNGWLRKPEYQEISEKIFILWDEGVTSWNGHIITTLRDLSHHTRRSENTIQQIKNTHDHEEYCRLYNKRQYRAVYGEEIKKFDNFFQNPIKQLDEVIEKLYEVQEKLEEL